MPVRHVVSVSTSEMFRAGRTRGIHALVTSSRAFALLATAVVLAGVGLVIRGLPSAPSATPAASHANPSATPSQPSPTAKPRPAPSFKRGEVAVEVYNNSGVHGLAAAVSARARDAGWNVVGSDNWYGTIPASTVYYPARLRSAATALARDLGISRVKPAVAPMRGDRLTVVLTGDYA